MGTPFILDPGIYKFNLAVEARAYSSFSPESFFELRILMAAGRVKQ